DDVRRQFQQIPGVTEAYPELRFTADVRLGKGGRVAQAASLPPSSSNAEAFESMQGHFFSAPDANEAIVQLALARDLTGKPDAEAKDLDLVGKDIIVRYAGRQPLASTDPAGDQTNAVSPDEAALGFSIVSSEITLRVVGIIDAEAVPTAA